MTDSQHDNGSTKRPDAGGQLEAGLEYLHKAFESLASGATTSFSLVEIDGEGRTRQSMVTLDGTHLDKLAAVLQQQSVIASHVAGRWQGNAPATARSNRWH